MSNIKTTQYANGVEGYLIYSGGGQFYFRVYNQHGKFTDYRIAHSDLCVKIVDPDAYFYHNSEQAYLDHSPETLGISVEKDK